jgi:glycosyltransferase involved in cell wall biosynthesis
MVNSAERPSLLTYSSLPYNGKGPAQSCVSILQHIPPASLSVSLMMPRCTKRLPASVKFKQALPEPLRRLPWKYVRGLGRRAVTKCFADAIEAADPRNTIAYFWPDHSTFLLQRAKARGIVTVREMINCDRGTAKAILDAVYREADLPPSHGISEESVAEEREQLALYDHVFASNQVERGLIDAGVDPSRILPTSFGWDPERFPGVRSAVPSARFTALFVGTVSIRKGVLQLLAAWKRSGVDGVLKIVGGVLPEISPKLEPYLNDPSIEFIGFQSQIADLYHSADLFIFPSFEEGGPQVVYEAAGCGLPVIATPMGGGRMVRDGVNGLIVQPNDLEGLAAAIRSMASSPEKRRAFGRQGAIDARKYTYEEIGKDRAAMLLRVIEKNNRI